MKAVIREEYGTPDVLSLAEVERPKPKPDEVLVKVHAATLNAGDLHILMGDSFVMRLMNGFRKPKCKIIGDDIAGKVVEVGSQVTRFQPGDEVFGVSNFGAFAEYACAREKLLSRKPASMTFEQAATWPMAAITALQALRDNGKIEAGKQVLIVGASGGVGTFAVQIAKTFGAEVTGVCSTNKIPGVLAAGADHVIDYTRESFVGSGQLYDLILGIGGNYRISEYRKALSHDGIYVCIGGESMKQYSQALFQGTLISMFSKKKMGASFGNPNQKDYDLLIELFEEGKVQPVIDKKFPLSEVPDSLRYLGGGNAIGKVIITVVEEDLK